MIEIGTIFSILAIIISIVSLHSTRRFWFSTHRPIVTAEITQNSSSKGVVIFDLTVYNSGNRPAVNITLSAAKLDIEKILSDTIKSENKKRVLSTFSSSMLPNVNPILLLMIY